MRGQKNHRTTSGMWLRVSIGIHFDDLTPLKKHTILCLKIFHTRNPHPIQRSDPRPQLSLDLLSMEDDT